MADNTTLNTGSGGDTLRTEDRTTFKTPVSIIDVGGTSAELLLGDSGGFLPLANTVKDGTGTFYAPLSDADGHLQIDVLSAPSTAVTNAGTFATQSTQAGTWTVDLGATDNAVLDSMVFLLTTIDSDTSTLAVVGGGVEATALRVTIASDSTGVLTVDDGGGSLTVDGTVTANLSATDNAVLDAMAASLVTIDVDTGSIDGKITACDTGAVVLASGTVTTVSTVTNLAQMGGVAIWLNTGVRDTGTQRVTIATDDVVPISAASLPLPSGAATEATLATIDTIQRNIAAGFATEGSALGSGVLLQGDDGTDRTNVLVDAAGHLQVDVLSGGGGGTQYTEGATDATITGTAILWEDAADTLVTVSSSKPLPVDLGSNNDITVTSGTLTAVTTITNTVTVSGTVTANLGATDNAVLDSIVTNTTGLAGTVSGSELQVDIVAALPAGTNAIGKLAANSGVDIGDVDVTSQPARDRLTDNIGVALQTDVILSDTTALTPKFEVIDDATSGNNTIVAAVASKKIRVLALMMVAAGDVLARFEDGAGGTALTGQMDLTTNSGFVLPFNPVGWFETGVNTLLNLELDGAVSCDGCLTYVEV